MHASPDTGAEVNVGGTKLLDQLQLCERDLRDVPYSQLVAGNGSLLKKLGTLPITITLNETSIKDNIVICEGQDDQLLSWKTYRNLAIIPDKFPKQIGKINVNPVTSEDRSQSFMRKQNLLEDYKEVFDCTDHLPCMNGDPMKIHLHVESSYTTCNTWSDENNICISRRNKEMFKGNSSTRNNRYTRR